MRLPNITLYGSTSCPDTQRSRTFLDERSIAYEYKDVDESPELNDYLAGLNGGKRILPTIRLNNLNLFNPTEEILAREVQSALSLC